MSDPHQDSRSSSTSADAHRAARVEGRLTRLRLELALVLRELREADGRSLESFAQEHDLAVEDVERLERVGDPTFAQVEQHLARFGAELLVAVKQDEDVVQVSDDADHLIVALPTEVDAWAAERDVSLEEYVRDALRAYRKT